MNKEHPNYKVKLARDDNYRVVELTPNPKFDELDFDTEEFFEDTRHIGSLSDCESWIRLHEGGYM